MGVFKGSMNYTRFDVEGELPKDFLTVFEGALALRKFVPLHEDGNDLETSGFVLAQSPFAEEVPLFNNAFYFDGRIVLALRVDTIRLPKAYVRALLKKRIAEQAAKLGEEPSRKTIKALEEAVLYEVRKRVFPKTQLVDFCWDTDKGQLRLFGRGKSLIERFTQLFEQTFSGVKVKQRTFAEQAQAMELPLRVKGQLDALVPQELFQPPQRVEQFE